MPRFKDYDQGQTVLLPVSFDRQILPGTFEYTFNCLVDHKLDLSIFHHKYNNDETGRPAYDLDRLFHFLLDGVLGRFFRDRSARAFFSDPNQCFWIWDDLDTKPLQSGRESAWMWLTFVLAGGWMLLFVFSVIYFI